MAFLPQAFRGEPSHLSQPFHSKGLDPRTYQQYVKQHPEKKAEIYSGFTIVRRHGDDLQGVPYHVAYQSFLDRL